MKTSSIGVAGRKMAYNREKMDSYSFENIFESVAFGLINVTPEGALLQANPAAARLLGLPRERLLQRSLADLVAGTVGSSESDKLLARVIDAGETISGLELSPADGTSPLSATMVPLRDAVGRTVGAVLTIFEPPEQKPSLLPSSAYAEVLAHAPVGIAIVEGGEFRLRWANEAYRQFLEEPFRTDPIGVPFRHLVPQAEKGGVIDIFRRVAETKVPFVDPEFEHVGFARGVTYWRWALCPLEGGEQPDLMLVVTEVTEQVIMRQKVEAERARLKTVLATLPVGVLIIELDGRIAEANEMVNRIWGGTAPRSENFASWREYRGWDPETATLLKPEDWPASRALRGETVLGEVVDIEKFDGSRGTIFLSAAPLRAGHGGVIGAVVVMQDISEQRLAEKALAEKERLLRVTFDKAFQLMGLLTPDGKLIQINQTAADFLGIDGATVLGQDFLNTPWWADPDEAQKLREGIQAALKGEFVRFETSHRRPDGRMVQIDFSLKPIFDEDGRVVLLLPEGRDITERKWLENELLRAKDAAEAANRAKSEFLATVSHELRTPLTVIMGMTELALQHCSDQEVHAFLEVAQSSSDSLLLLINDILTISEMETRNLVLAYASFSVRECLEDVIDGFSAQAREKGLDLSWQVAAEVPDTIRSDPARVRQILVNLIGNAVKFTSHGTVSVRVKRHDPEILFLIRDTGIGVPEEKRDRLFKPFSQVDSSSTREFSGTGLGLAISKGLVERLGGRIWMEEEEGGGCRFCITLPNRHPSGTPSSVRSRRRKAQQ